MYFAQFKGIVKDDTEVKLTWIGKDGRATKDRGKFGDVLNGLTAYANVTELCVSDKSGCLLFIADCRV